MNHRVLPLPPARGRRLQVVIEQEMQGLFPVLVTVIPTVRAGARYDDLQSIEVIADALRLATRRLVDIYKEWHPQTTLARTRGVLFMENWNNDGHRAVRQNVRLREVRAGLLWEMFENVY